MKMYYSTIRIYIFGVAKYATEHINTYVYEVGGGAKGGDHISSLICKNVDAESLIKEWGESGGLAGKSFIFAVNDC